MIDTNLAQAIEAADASSSYDANVKFLFADKQILARSLKYAVQEFKDMAVDDIMNSIGDNIDIGTRPLDVGLTNLGRVNAAATEDNIPGEGKIFFDIRFTAFHKETEMKFLINIDYSDFWIIPINSFCKQYLRPFKQVYRNNFLIAS